jgi:hypothetical protein
MLAMTCCWHSVREANVCSRWSRDLARQIKRKELEVRRLETVGKWTVHIRPYSFAAIEKTALKWDTKGCSVGNQRKDFKTMRAAVEWAERQNRKEGGK